MSQLSRPYQLALASVLVFAVAWFAVLHQHTTATTGSSTGASAPSAEASSPTVAATPSKESLAKSEEKAAAKPTHVYKGVAPGAEGLTRDVRKAHETVGASQQEAHHVESETGEGGAGKPSSGTAAHASAGTRSSGTATHARAGTQSSGTATHAGADPAKGAAGTSTSPGSAAKPASSATSSGHVTKSTGSPPSSSSAASATPSGSPATRLATQLKEGRTVLLLFWNPHSSTDVTVRKQVQDVARSLGHKVAASYARASEVGRFGTVTRDVTVNETPTLLVIGKHGLVTSIAGLTDAFSIEQAVREAH